MSPSNTWQTACYQAVVEAADDQELKYETGVAILRLVVALGLLIGFVSLVGWRYRDELGRFGTWFVARWGVGGLIVGAALADGIHFPIPPQFYLLTGIAAGYSHLATFGSVMIGSEIGTFIAFQLGRVFARSTFVAKRIAKPRALLERFIHRYGYLGLATVTLLPISWCVMAATVGAMKLPYRTLFVIGAMRVPKLLVAYVFLVWAWHS